MGNHLNLFESDLHNFGRLAPFILAVQKFKPGLITAVRDMQDALILAIERNKEELSFLYYNNEYELSLDCIDFIKDCSCDGFIRKSKEVHDEKIKMDIINLETVLQSYCLNENLQKIIKHRICKLRKHQDEYIAEQKEKLKEITREIKRKNKEILKTTIPHPFRLSDLTHEYDFVKVIAWYYFLNSRERLIEKLQSPESEHQEKLAIAKKYHFFFTKALGNCNEKETDSQKIIAPDDVFCHRRIKYETQVNSTAVGELEKCEEGYMLDINSTILVSNNFEISEKELINSVKRAIYISLYSNYEVIFRNNNFDIENTFYKIDSLIENEKEKFEKRHKRHSIDIIYGFAIAEIKNNNTTIESSIKKLEEELRIRFNESPRFDYEKLEIFYKKAAREIKKYQSLIESNRNH